MKMPWEGKTGLAKATAFFATLLGVSLGLCGVNIIAVMGAASWGDSSPVRSVAGSILTLTGIAEIVGAVVGIVGLVVVAIIAVGRFFRGHEDDE